MVFERREIELLNSAERLLCASQSELGNARGGLSKWTKKQLKMREKIDNHFLTVALTSSVKQHFIAGASAVAVFSDGLITLRMRSL